ncbi:hypothetical protein BH23PAT1_BH23PAT1_5170 [soil metagenome]
MSAEGAPTAIEEPTIPDQPTPVEPRLCWPDISEEDMQRMCGGGDSLRSLDGPPLYFDDDLEELLDRIDNRAKAERRATDHDSGETSPPISDISLPLADSPPENPQLTAWKKNQGPIPKVTALNLFRTGIRRLLAKS